MYRPLSIHVLRWSWYFIIRSVDSNFTCYVLFLFGPLKKLLVSILYWNSNYFNWVGVCPWDTTILISFDLQLSNLNYRNLSVQRVLNQFPIQRTNLYRMNIIQSLHYVTQMNVSQCHTLSSYLRILLILWNFDFMCPWISFRFIS